MAAAEEGQPQMQIARTLHEASRVPKFQYGIPASLYGSTIFMPVLVETAGWMDWLRWKGMSHLWMAVNYATQALFIVGVHDVCVAEHEGRDPDTCEPLMPGLLFVGLFACTVAVLTDIQETYDIWYLVMYHVPTLPRTAVCKFKEDAGGELRLVEGGFSSRRKVGVYLFILLPKLLLACFLVPLAFAFLVVSPGNMDIILNATALIFIIEMDESFFWFFSLPEVRCIMEAVPKFEAGEIKREWKRPAIQLAKFLVSFGMVLWGLLTFHWCGNDGLWMPLWGLST